MRRRILLLTAMAAGVGFSLPMAAGGDEKLPESASQPLRTLGEFSESSQALYKKVSRSLVRVRMENGAPGMSPPQLLKESPQLLKEFEEWRQKQGAGGGIVGPRRERLDRKLHDGRVEGDAGATTLPWRQGGGGLGSFRKFLEQKLKDGGDPETQTRIHGILAHIEAARAGQGGSVEVTGVLIDDQGNAVVAWGPLHESAGATFRVTGPDGTEVGAKYVGSHMGRGLGVIKLESPGIAEPMAMAEGSPAGGELLMCLSARQGGLGWIAAPAANVDASGKKGSEGRFAILGGEERGTTYLFNTKGELAAVGNDKFGMPMEVLKADIHWIIKNGKDIGPRRLGVKYDPVLPEMRRKMTGLGDRAAVVVREVQAGSPAEKAGLKKDDVLVAIDGVSIGLLPQIQADLATRSGTVPVDIFRGGVEKKLDMPLGDK